ncbi:hypothetical protein ACFSL4_33670 [Streptomyces caeni]|uniref:Uncharacterized protein n=1 Tax=Streptomyces caeni TaxID=2307231 RepID=A0ABW4J181_9ACTN
MNEARSVTWRETMLVLLVCWVVCGLAFLVLAASDEPGVPVGAPVVMFLAQWFWTRHRHWAAGALAALLGCGTAFLLTDALHLGHDRLTADTVAVEAGLLVALVVFTGVSRLSVR